MSFLFVLLKARVLDVFLSRVRRIHLGNTPDSACRIVIWFYSLLIYIDNLTFFQSIAYVLSFSCFPSFVYWTPFRSALWPAHDLCTPKRTLAFSFFYLTFQLVSFSRFVSCTCVQTHHYELNCQDGVCHLLWRTQRRQQERCRFVCLWYGSVPSWSTANCRFVIPCCCS